MDNTKEEQITLRLCLDCGGMNYSRLRDCLLCHKPLEIAVVGEDVEQPTLRKGHKHLIMFLEAVSGPVKGDKFLLKNGLILGRSNSADIQIMSEEASRQHAEITLTDTEEWLLADLGSTNGTFHNGVEISVPVALKPGDEVGVGDGFFMVKGGK